MNYRDLNEIKKIDNSAFLKLIPDFNKNNMEVVDKLVRSLESTKFLLPVLDDNSFYEYQGIICICSDYKRYKNLIRIKDDKFKPKIVYFNQLIKMISCFDDIKGIIINPNDKNLNTLYFDKPAVLDLKDVLKPLYTSEGFDLKNSGILDKMKSNKITEDLLEQVKKSKFIVPFDYSININTSINFDKFDYPIQIIDNIKYLNVFTDIFEYSLFQEEFQYSMILNYDDILNIVKDINVNGIIIDDNSNFCINK